MRKNERAADRPEIMPDDRPVQLDPYTRFTRAEWARLARDTVLPLSEAELAPLTGLIEAVSLDEVRDIYLPLAGLIHLYFQAARQLHDASTAYLGAQDNAADEAFSPARKMPFIIGLAGSVAVGKSTLGRILSLLLSRLHERPVTALVPTDGFLKPNVVLEGEGLMARKGFPESYNTRALLQFLTRLKSGEPEVEAPVYSHFSYDILPDKTLTVRQPDILLLEGLNVLQPAKLPPHGRAIPFVSDFFDFSIYLDADPDLIETWYVERFCTLRQTAFRDPGSYFHRYAHLSDHDAIATAQDIWRQINLKNLRENILPTRQRARLILTKGADHRVQHVALRKL